MNKEIVDKIISIKRHQRDIELLEAERAEVDADQFEINTQINQMEQDIEQWKTEIEEEIKDVVETQKTVKELMTRIKRHERDIELLDEERLEVGADQFEINTQINLMERDIEAWKKQLESLPKTLEEQTKDLESQIKEFETRIQRHERDIELLDEERQEPDADQFEINTQINLMEQDIQDIKEWKQKIKECQEELKNIEAVLEYINEMRETSPRKPAEPKPAEPKPAEPKPAEPKPAEEFEPFEPFLEEEPDPIKKIKINIDQKGTAMEIDTQGKYERIGRKTQLRSSLLPYQKKGIDSQLLEEAQAIGDTYVIREILSKLADYGKEAKEEQLRKYIDVLRGKYTTNSPFEINYDLRKIRKAHLPEGEREALINNAKKIRDLNIKIKQETGEKNAFGTVKATIGTQIKWFLQDKGLIKTSNKKELPEGKAGKPTGGVEEKLETPEERFRERFRASMARDSKQNVNEAIFNAYDPTLIKRAEAAKENEASEEEPEQEF